MLTPRRNGEIESSTWVCMSSILHLIGKLTKKWKSGEEQQCVLKRKKGCRLKHKKYGETMNYSFLALKCSPPSMHPRGSIYSSPMDNGGSSRSVSRHMEGQESSYSGLIEENSKSFCFYAHFPMYGGYNGATCVYTWVLA